MRWMVAGLVAAVLAGCAIEEEEAPPPARPVPKEKVGRRRPPPRPKEPPPEMAKLDFLLGKWNVTEKHHPSPWMPQGGTANGQMIVVKRMQGSALVLSFAAASKLGKYYAHGILAYAPEASEYRMWWFESLSPGEVFTLQGTFEGKSLRLTGDVNWKGEHFRARVSFTPRADGSVGFLMEADEGRGWSPVVESSLSK